MSDVNDRFITFSPYEADQLTVLGVLYAGPEDTGYVLVKEAFDDTDIEAAAKLVGQWIEDLQEELDGFQSALEDADEEETDEDIENYYDFSDIEEDEDTDEDAESVYGDWKLYAGVWNDGDTTSLEFDDSFHANLDPDSRIAMLTDIATAAMAAIEAIRAGYDGN